LFVASTRSHPSPLPNIEQVGMSRTSRTTRVLLGVMCSRNLTPQSWRSPGVNTTSTSTVSTPLNANILGANIQRRGSTARLQRSDSGSVTGHVRHQDSSPHDGGEIQRAAVTKANPKLTAHTVESLLEGARRGWTLVCTFDRSPRQPGKVKRAPATHPWVQTWRCG